MVSVARIVRFEERQSYERILGKQWHTPKTAFRPRAGQLSYEKRTLRRKAIAAMKAKEKEMRNEKNDERQV